MCLRGCQQVVVREHPFAMCSQLYNPCKVPLEEQMRHLE